MPEFLDVSLSSLIHLPEDVDTFSPDDISRIMWGYDYTTLVLSSFHDPALDASIRTRVATRTWETLLCRQVALLKRYRHWSGDEHRYAFRQSDYENHTIDTSLNA